MALVPLYEHFKPCFPKLTPSFEQPHFLPKSIVSLDNQKNK